MFKKREFGVAFLVAAIIYVFLNFLNLAHLNSVFTQAMVGVLSLMMGAVVLSLVPVIKIFGPVLKEPTIQKRLKMFRNRFIAIRSTLSFTALIVVSCLFVWFVLSLPLSLLQVLIGGTSLGFLGGLICNTVIYLLLKRDLSHLDGNTN